MKVIGDGSICVCTIVITKDANGGEFNFVQVMEGYSEILYCRWMELASVRWLINRMLNRFGSLQYCLDDEKNYQTQKWPRPSAFINCPGFTMCAERLSLLGDELKCDLENAI